MIKAKYTVVLKTLLDNPDVKPLIDKAMSTYPMFTPQNEFIYTLIPTREELNKKILNYYKYREIGFETVGRFLDELEISLNEIMPYYNQKYKSIDVMNGIDDLFKNVDITETFEQNSEGSSKGDMSGLTTNSQIGSSEGSSESTATTNSTTKSNVDSYGKNVDSTMPQDNITLKNSDIDSVSHADKVEWNHNTSNDESTNNGTDKTNSSSSSINTTEGDQQTTQHNEVETTNKQSQTLHRQGNHGVNTYAHDIKQFRELFTNIEQQIINDRRIAELFMTIY